jgi:hypothetical protein
MNITRHEKELARTLEKQAQAQAKAIATARNHTSAMREALVQAIVDYNTAVAHEHTVIDTVNAFLASQRVLGRTEHEVARQQDVIVDTASETLDLIDEYLNNNDMVDIDNFIDSLNENDVDETDFDEEVVE